MKKILKKSGEDYLEAIYNLLQNDDHAHLVDIAKSLGVTKPSASEAIKNLLEQGYIIKESYGSITLTKKGEDHAKSVLKKHNAISTLLVDILGVSEQTAETDACKIEHCLSEETTKKLFEFLAKFK
jgi:Mn-dependent DtxR family transcriptional regulator